MKSTKRFLVFCCMLIAVMLFMSQDIYSSNKENLSIENPVFQSTVFDVPVSFSLFEKNDFAKPAVKIPVNCPVENYCIIQDDVVIFDYGSKREKTNFIYSQHSITNAANINCTYYLRC